MENMPIDDNSIDWVISNCVINLSPDKSRVFAEIYRVLRPGGRILVSDIVATEPLPADIRKDIASWVGCIGGAVIENAYLRIAEEAGLVDVAVVDRLPYDEAQILAMGNCGCDSSAGAADARARRLAGKIASVKVFARKPA
jgi:SAM-dependent methyltransferase